MHLSRVCTRQGRHSCRCLISVQGFLTAVRQEVNRRHAANKWALDDVVLTSEVTHPAKDVDGIAGPPNEGVFVYGLYLDGCAWSNKENKLVDSEPKKLYSALPILHVTGVQVNHAAERPYGALCCMGSEQSHDWDPHAMILS